MVSGATLARSASKVPIRLSQVRSEHSQRLGRTTSRLQRSNRVVTVDLQRRVGMTRLAKTTVKLDLTDPLKRESRRFRLPGDH